VNGNALVVVDVLVNGIALVSVDVLVNVVALVIVDVFVNGIALVIVDVLVNGNAPVNVIVIGALAESAAVGISDRSVSSFKCVRENASANRRDVSVPAGTEAVVLRSR
jgi:hypothetical protein